MPHTPASRRSGEYKATYAKHGEEPDHPAPPLLKNMYLRLNFPLAALVPEGEALRDLYGRNSHADEDPEMGPDGERFHPLPERLRPCTRANREFGPVIQRRSRAASVCDS